MGNAGTGDSGRFARPGLVAACQGAFGSIEALSGVRELSTVHQGNCDVRLDSFATHWRPECPRLLLATIVFLDALGYGLLVPILPGVVRRFGTAPSFVSQYYGYFISVYALAQFFAAPILGSLSDRYGRRPVLLGSLAGAAVDYILMAYAPTLSLLLMGRVLSGVTGASMAVANAYLADVSDQHERSADFGMVAAALGFGILGGPALGGLLSRYGLTVPFLSAALLASTSFAAALILLPESLAPASRRKLDLARWNPICSLGRLLGTAPASRWAWCYLLVYLAARATSSVWTLFTERRFGWSPLQVGASFALMGLAASLAQSLLPRAAIPWLGEERVLRFGLLVSFFSYMSMGLVETSWALCITVVIAAFSGVVCPVLLSLMSRRASPHAQGELQGNLGSMTSLTAVVGPLLYTEVFARTASKPSVIPVGAPFFLAAAFCLAAWLLTRARHTAH